MVNIRLSKHNIRFSFFADRLITESEIGKWLDVNRIEYKINEFSENDVVYLDGKLRFVCIIDSMMFYNEEDVMAFKLRWTK